VERPTILQSEVLRTNKQETMTENQKLRLDLFREFKGEAQKAYDFIMAGEKSQPMQTEKKAEDGLYYVYADDSYSPCDGKKPEKEVKYIGIIHEGHPFSVGLKDLGSYQLLKDGVKCEKTSDFYKPRECDALNDWEYVERTKRIQRLGTDIPLSDGEYIPALPMVVAMCYWADKGLNEALELAGGTPFNMDECYWSVTENYSNYAWLVFFNNGVVNYYGKYISIVVRPVAAFNI